MRNAKQNSALKKLEAQDSTKYVKYPKHNSITNSKSEPQRCNWRAMESEMSPANTGSTPHSKQAGKNQMKIIYFLDFRKNFKSTRERV